MNKKIAIIYDHDRCYTKTISSYIEKGINSQNIQSVSYTIDFILNKKSLLDKVNGIIFGAPTHFGNVSTNMKKFMDSTTSIWRDKKWKNKIAAAFTHSGALNGDKMSCLMSMFIFAQQHGMIWTGIDVNSNEKIYKYNVELNRLGSWIGLMVESIKKDAVVNVSDIKTAEYFGERVAKVSKSFA